MCNMSIGGKNLKKVEAFDHLESIQSNVTTMTFLRIQKLCLNSIGYSFETKESLMRRIYALLAWISLLIIAIPEIHFVFENLSDIPLATDALCPLLTVILSLSKVITFYFQKQNFYHIIKELDDLWLNTSETDRIFLETGQLIDTRLTLTYFVSTVSVGILYLTFPIVKATYEIYTTGSAVWIMPMRSTFIYDISVSPNYELTFLWFVQCTQLSAFGSVGVDCLFYGACFNIRSHFQIIQNKIRNIKFEKIIGKHGDNKGKAVVTEEFRNVVLYHRNILDICEEFSNLYSVVLFIQFMITSVQLCVIAFQLTLPNQEIVIMATFVLFLAAICFQLFTYCHAGSQLTSESLAVADAIYGSCWYESTPPTRKSIVFFLMRSQKNIIVYSGFYVASLETFKAILSAAGSYIAILQSLSEN